MKVSRKEIHMAKKHIAKRWLNALLAVAIAAGLTACGESTTTETTTAATTTTAAATTAAAGADETTTAAPAAETTAAAEETEAVEAEDDVIPAETVTLDVYSQLSNYSGEQVGWFADVMLEKFNVKINIIQEQEGTFETRISEGTLGDIVIFGDDTDDYRNSYQGGYLFNWDDEDLLLNYGSYIAENMAPALEKNRSISEGGLYGFGHNVGTSATDHESFFYYPDLRWDLYAQLGYPTIATLEDYIPVLKEMVALEPTSDTGAKTYGASLFKDWDGSMVMFVKATGALYGLDEFGIGLYDTKTQTYEDSFAEGSEYLRYTKFYNNMYREGLLDPDSMTQTYDDVLADYQTGAAFFQLFNWLGSGVYNGAHEADGKMLYAKTPDDATNICYGLNVYGGNRLWTIGADTQYPELCMSIINWLSTPEGVMTYSYGPKGLTWDYDANGAPYLTELGLTAKGDGTTPMPAPYSGTYTDGSFQMNNTTWSMDATNPEAADGSTFNYIFWDSYTSRESSEIMQDWKDTTGYNTADDYLNAEHISVSIGSQFNRGSMDEEMNVIWSSVTTAIKTATWKAIYAKDDAEFDAIISAAREELNQLGYAKCVEFDQEQAAIRKQKEDEAVAAANG
jgi:multiple sugar transport system substrate-binding protein/putative aldouronate transport system substrate-binding protein